MHYRFKSHTKYIEIQASILHVHIDQQTLVSIHTVSKELNKISMPEFSHQFHFSVKSFLAFIIGVQRLYDQPLNGNLLSI